MRLLIAMLALAAPAAALAADEVRLTSEVFVERNVPQPDGTVRKVREAPNVVTPGDTLIFILSYRNEGAAAATGFVVTNPMPEFGRLCRQREPGRDRFGRRRQQLGRARLASRAQCRRHHAARRRCRRDPRSLALRGADRRR